MEANGGPTEFHPQPTYGCRENQEHIKVEERPLWELIHSIAQDQKDVFWLLQFPKDSLSFMKLPPVV